MKKIILIISYILFFLLGVFITVYKGVSYSDLWGDKVCLTYIKDIKVKSWSKYIKGSPSEASGSHGEIFCLPEKETELNPLVPWYLR